MTPLVSILIPAYNAEKFIAFAIRSALEQTWPTLEVIVVDDGSTDRTHEVARQFAANPKVRLLRQRRRGAAAARNAALEHSRGDYIQWLDADDYIAPDKIELQLAALRPEYGSKRLLSCGWGYFRHRPWKASLKPSELWRDSKPVEWMINKLEKNLFMANGTWLVSREVTKEAGPWDERLSLDDDGEYFARVLAASEGVTFVEGPLAYYRIAQQPSLSDVGTTRADLDSQLLSMRLQIAILLSMEDTARTRYACRRYIQNAATVFHGRRADLVEALSSMMKDHHGELEAPKLSGKYAKLQTMLGWSAANIFRRQLNRVKGSVVTLLDRVLFLMEPRSRPCPRFSRNAPARDGAENTRRF